MHVIATAGHVDHGKSTLVRALTGIEPDRLAEERRRGMTLDLGFAWTRVEDETIAFVDVPGHERFVPTMLAGVGPVPAALVVVAADEGWRAQTTEHVSILDSLGVEYAVLAVTRADLADPAPALRDGVERLSRTSLGRLRTVDAVGVSGVTGLGLDQLRGALLRLVRRMPAPVLDTRVRFFIDRSFSIRGAGTVVTGTLGAGTITAGDSLTLTPGGARVKVRGLQSLGESVTTATPVSRVAVNLRGISLDDAPRGACLLSPDAWALTRTADVRLSDIEPGELPGDLMFHIGSSAVPCRLRPLGEDTCRVTLAEALPLQPGDRAVLRDSSRRLATGLTVLDVEPPALRRRGDAAARAAVLETATGTPDPVAEVTRRGLVSRHRIALIGVLPRHAAVPSGLLEVGDFVVAEDTWRQLGSQLVRHIDAQRSGSPLDAGVSLESARKALSLPDISLVDELVRASGGALVSRDGRLARPGSGPTFGDAARAALDEMCARLDSQPFAAPESRELEQSGLTPAVLAAATRAGMVLRLPGEIVVHTQAAQRAVDVLRDLPQPFTAAEARAALGTTRRVAIPLLEHLDRLGLTVRVDETHRRLR